MDNALDQRQQQPQGQAPWQQTGPVLAAIAGGIGVIGFVTFVGGAIEYARLRTAGLPAEEAIAVVPTANLIAIGAKTLVPAVIFALSAAALVFVWRLSLDDAGLSEDARRERLDKGAVALAALFAVTEAIAFFLDVSSGFRVIATVIGLGLLTTGLVYFVAKRTRAHFFWVALTTFLAAGVFVASLAYARTRDTLHVRPAALIRGGDATTGFFIAETSSQIYLGRTLIGQDKPRILVLPKDEISDVALGPLLSPTDAYLRAQALARELCRMQGPGPGNTDEATNESDCQSEIQVNEPL
jgi:hypothetical protein